MTIARHVFDPNTGKAIFVTPDNPATLGLDGSIGSLANIEGGGRWFAKFGANVTDWTEFAASTGSFVPTSGAASMTGPLVIGTDPGGSEILRLGGDVASGRIRIIGALGGYGGSTRYIGHGGSASIIYFNVPTGGQHIFAVNEIGAASISSTVFSGGLIVQQGGQGTHFLGTNAANTTSTTLSIRGGSVSGGVAGLDLIGGGSQIKWSQGSVVDWMIYQNQADPLIYWRDVVNSRMQMTLAPGTTDSTALTTFNSKVTAMGLLTATLNLAVGGTAAITGTTLTLDSALTALTAQTITAYGLNFLASGAALRIRVGGLLVSSAYSQDNLVPANGIYSAGAIVTATSATIGSTLTAGSTVTINGGAVWTLTGWSKNLAMSDGGAIEFGTNRAAGSTSYGIGTSSGNFYFFWSPQRTGSGAVNYWLIYDGATSAFTGHVSLTGTLTVSGSFNTGGSVLTGAWGTNLDLGLRPGGTSGAVYLMNSAGLTRLKVGNTDVTSQVNMYAPDFVLT